MATTKVVIEGDRELAKALAEILDGVQNLGEGPGTEAAKLVAQRAEARAPVQSGALRDTIRTFARKSNAGIRIGFARTPYAGPIVGGHGGPGAPRAQGGYVLPNPFPFDALDSRYSAVIATYERHIEKLLAGKPVRSPEKYKRHETA